MSLLLKDGEYTEIRKRAERAEAQLREVTAEREMLQALLDEEKRISAGYKRSYHEQVQIGMHNIYESRKLETQLAECRAALTIAEAERDCLQSAFQHSVKYDWDAKQSCAECASCAAALAAARKGES